MIKIFLPAYIVHEIMDKYTKGGCDYFHKDGGAFKLFDDQALWIYTLDV